MPQRKPNILFVVLDTLRRDRLSLYGHSRETSPQLDEFAASAAVFRRAISPAQWTVPAHASLFTGLYPGAHGLTQASGRLSGSHPTIAEILQASGYHTVGFCNNPLVGVLDHGLTRGFDEFYNYSSVVPARPIDAQKSALRRALTRRFHPYMRKAGSIFARNDELFRLALHPLLVPLWARYINFKGHTGNSISDLIGYLQAQRAGGMERPLFAFVNLMGAHLPYQPPQDFLNRIAPGVRDDRNVYGFIRRFNADAAAWASPPDPPLADWQRQALLDFYDAEIARQDAHLGRLFAALESSGALDDTAVIVLADHGEAHGDHAQFGHGFVVYQELVHVPLIVHLPGQVRGREITRNISTRRLFHTLLEIAGVQPPLDEADPNANVAGLSLLREMDASASIEDNLAFSEAVPPATFLHVLEHRNPAVIERLLLRQIRRGVYDGDHKLTTVGEAVEGLYDVARDAEDARDLSGDNPALTETLQRKLSDFTASTQHDMRDESSGVVSEAVEEQLRALGYIE